MSAKSIQTSAKEDFPNGEWQVLEIFGGRGETSLLMSFPHVSGSLVWNISVTKMTLEFFL